MKEPSLSGLGLVAYLQAAYDGTEQRSPAKKGADVE